MSTWEVRESLLGSFDNVEEDKQKKQNYLIENIIKQGYDKQLFAEYMAESKDNGNDIDNWTLIEIMDMVEEFKRSVAPPEPEKNISDDDDDDYYEDGEEPKFKGEMSPINKGENNLDSEDDLKFANLPMRDEDRKSLEKQKSKDPADIEKEAMIVKMLEEDNVSHVNTKLSQCELSKMQKRDIRVNVTDGLVKKGGMFSFSYATYKIELEPIGYYVRRKESDFSSLRKYL